MLLLKFLVILTFLFCNVCLLNQQIPDQGQAYNIVGMYAES